VDQGLISGITSLLAETMSLVDNERERASRQFTHLREIELRDLQAARQQELADLNSRLERETSLQKHRDRIGLQTYPMIEGPGHLREAMTLLSEDLSELPLLVLLAPFADETGDSPWAGLREALIRQLGRLEAKGLITVRRLARPASWPHPALYWNDLYGIATLLVEIGLDRQTLDIRLGGCHLTPGARSPIVTLRSVYAMTLPDRDAWSDSRVAAMNATRAPAARLAPPTTPDATLALNRELAARVITLVIVSGVDAYHLMVSPRYDQQFDIAAADAAVADVDWPADLGIPADLVADPAYHRLHTAARLARRADPAAAERELLAALRVLAEDDGDRPGSGAEPGLIELARAVADAGEPYIAKTTEVLGLFDSDRPVPAIIVDHMTATVDPARLMRRFSAGREQILHLLDRGAELARTLGPIRETLAVTFADARFHVDSKRLHLVITGPEGAGKSTLINALLGYQLAPIADAYPGTVAPVLFRHGDVDQPRYSVRFTSGETRLCANAAAFAKLLLQEHNAENKEGVVAAEVLVRHPLLANGLTLVDMPGLVGTSPAVTEAAWQLLRKEEAGTTLIAVYRPRLQNSPLRSALQGLRKGSRLRIAAVVANAELDVLSKGDDRFQTWMAHQRSAIDNVLLDGIDLNVPSDGIFMVNLEALSGRLSERAAEMVKEVPSHSEQIAALRQAIWQHVKANGVDAVLEQARATVRAILTELGGLAKTRAALLAALVAGNLTEADIERQLAAATAAADRRWRTAYSTERVTRSADAAWPAFAREADAARRELLDAIAVCESEVDGGDRVTGDDITKQQSTLMAAVSEANQRLEDAAKSAATEMVGRLTADLNVALEAFFAEMPLLHDQLSAKVTPTAPSANLPQPVADTNDAVSNLAILTGGTVGGVLGGGSGIAVLVGLGLTPFGAALFGAIGAAIAVGWTVHLIRGGNRGKARRVLADIRRSVAAGLDTGGDGPLRSAWTELFNTAGSAVDAHYDSRIDALHQLVRDPSGKRATLDAECARVERAAIEIDELRRRIEQPGFGRTGNG
jgi:energy-coupling factor transporter ATP-binding protein EcfA2